jgi:DNA-binding response OmpR family regulator
MRVAVLQTDPSYRNLISDVVKRLGHTVVTFGDGLLLSKALSRSTVDLLILDWNSSGLCGLDLLKSVRSSFGERVPVMFATPDGAEHNVVCALTAGADDYVVYPIRRANSARGSRRCCAGRTPPRRARVWRSGRIASIRASRRLPCADVPCN